MTSFNSREEVQTHVLACQTELLSEISNHILSKEDQEAITTIVEWWLVSPQLGEAVDIAGVVVVLDYEPAGTWVGLEKEPEDVIDYLHGLVR